MTMHPKVQVTLRDRRGLADILIIGGGRGGGDVLQSEKFGVHQLCFDGCIRPSSRCKPYYVLR